MGWEERELAEDRSARSAMRSCLPGPRRLWIPTGVSRHRTPPVPTASKGDESVRSRRSCREFPGHRHRDTASRLPRDHGKAVRPHSETLPSRNSFRLEQTPSAKKSMTRRGYPANPRAAQLEFFAPAKEAQDVEKAIEAEKRKRHPATDE